MTDDYDDVRVRSKKSPSAHNRRASPAKFALLLKQNRGKVDAVVLAVEEGRAELLRELLKAEPKKVCHCNRALIER
jgi:hypothetical protein